MNNDLISREALKKALEEDMEYGGVKTDEFDKGYDLGIKTAIEMLDNAPTVEARPQGEWSFNPYDSYSYCSLCKVKAPFGYKNFCPNCGADMRKGGAE